MLACMQPGSPTECHGTCNLSVKQKTESLLTSRWAGSPVNYYPTFIIHPRRNRTRKSFCTEAPTLFFIQKGYHTSPTPLNKRG
ncbi:hypothetical protein Peur_017808 [Populus x canadensis]|uniref:Uncharacterized protein n=1 Tax=Populus trichocarpa TaxID=3694 RepID=U5G4I8_POPTR